jgi:hypothetical protein
MTPAATEKAANVILAAAAVGVTVVVLRTPRLRRLAWGLARNALTGSAPAWFGREVRQAWAASGRQVR